VYELNLFCGLGRRAMIPIAKPLLGEEEQQAVLEVWE
jgi:hypothetical protein